MRFGGNFNPEWGYLAPAPSFMRTARIVAVATAIGATAGAAVVLSLADRVGPAPDGAANANAGKTLVVVRSLVQPAEAAVASVPAALRANTMGVRLSGRSHGYANMEKRCSGRPGSG